MEEGAVAEDGAADATAVLILAKLGFVTRGLQDAATVEDVVAEVLVGRTVELVRSRGGDDVDDTTSGAAGFGGVAVGLGR